MMTLRKGYTSLVLLTVLIAMLALESLCQRNPAPETPYEKFLWQHFDNPRTNAGDQYCNIMMQRRRLTSPICKKKNTFIHSPVVDILQVCTDVGGKVYTKNLQESLRPFSTTTCEHKGGSTRPPCEYWEDKSQAFIVIACEGNRPVHFEKTITP